MTFSVTTYRMLTLDITTFSIMTYLIMIFSTTTFSIMTQSFMTFRLTFRIVTFSTMEQHTLKNVNSCWNTKYYFYLETSGGQNSNIYLNIVQRQC